MKQIMRKFTLVRKPIFNELSLFNEVVSGDSIKMWSIRQDIVNIVYHFPSLKFADEKWAILLVVLGISIRFSILNKYKFT